MSRLVLYHFCDDHGPVAIWCTTVHRGGRKGLTSTCLAATADPDSCPSCYLLLFQGPTFTTTQLRDGSSVVSCSKVGLDCMDDTADLVHQVGLRVFSHEVMGTDNSTMFIDDVMVVGTCFKVQDPTARGCHRKYAATLIFHPNSSTMFKDMVMCNKHYIAESMTRFDSLFDRIELNPTTDSDTFDYCNLQGIIQLEHCTFLAKFFHSCTFVPTVVFLQAGQARIFTNSQPTLLWKLNK